MSAYSNRAKLGSRNPSKSRSTIRSKADLLLSEDENNQKQTTKVNQLAVVSNEDDMEACWKLFAVPAPKYEYPVEEKVPGGVYFAEIKQMEIRRKGDQVILDVGYQIKNYKGIFRILQSYPAGSMPFKKLRKAIADAGIDAASDIRVAVGMSEKIVLAYVSKHSDIGSIIDRTPWKDPNSTDEEPGDTVTQDDDSEFDDFLEDEE